MKCAKELKNGILNYKWRHGFHCSSTAVMNVLSYYGLPLSEEMVFGLGKGLGWVYMKDEKLPYPYISGRGSNLIDNSLKQLGIDLKIISGDFTTQFNYLKEKVNNGNPAIVTLDLNKLSYIKDFIFDEDIYYVFSEHHAIVLWVDDEEIVLKDHLWPSMTIPIKVFKEAWSSDKVKPFKLNNIIYDIDPRSININKKDIYKAGEIALESNIHEFLSPCNPVNQSSGIRGLKNFLKDFDSIQNIYSDKDLSVVLKLISLPLDKIGTGGGNFRKLFGKFLLELGNELCLDYLKDYYSEYLNLSKKWKLLSKNLEERANQSNKELLRSDLELLIEIVDREINTANKISKDIRIMENNND